MSTNVDFNTPVKLEEEKERILNFYSSFLCVGRSIIPRLTFYNDADATMTITSRPFGDHKDRNDALRMMLFALPPVSPTLSILALHETVNLVDRSASCIVIIAFNRSGAIAEVFPYEVIDGQVKYDYDAQLTSENNGSFSQYIGHMLPIFARSYKPPFTLQNMVDYLTAHHYEIELHNGWTISRLKSMHP